ncbi:MAG: H+transporting two-sector ATPase C subunit [Chloroflexi bacterium]|nr:H+transporting two-sector ATPase C subunit [Chloroflexota bacterium]
MLALNSLGLVLIAILSLILATRVLAQEGVPPGQQGAAADTGIAFLAAGLATGLAAIAAGIAVGMTGSAAIGAVAEKPELFGRFLVIVGLAEGIAIYGLIVSILILGRI